MSRSRVLSLLATALLCLTGCFEVEQEYTLNPDGSGKVVHQVRQPDVMGQGEAGLKEILKQQLEEAQGVDAWSDITVRVTEDDSFEFRGTAYFSNLNDLSLKDAETLRFGWEQMSGGAGRLMLQTEATSESTPAGSSDDAQERLDEALKEWKQMRPMMQGLLGSFKWQASFHLPGEVTASSNFEKSGPREVLFAINGERYFEEIDAMMSDAEFLEQQAAQGSLDMLDPESEAMPAVLVTRLFGEDGAYVTTAAAAKPTFDYASAVAAAGTQFEEMLASLPVDAPAAVIPAAKGGDLTGLEIVQASYVTDGDRAWATEGASLSCTAVLPGAVIAVEPGQLTRAISDDGADLLPEEEWSRSVDASLDSEDPTRVSFDLKTKLPSAAAKGFRELAGVLYYVSASEPDEEISLFDSISPGAAGKALGASIGEIGPGYEDGSEQLVVELGIPREELNELIFLDAGGSRLDAQLISTSWSDASTTLTYSLDREFPRNGKIRAMVRRGLTRYEVPFSLGNIDLLGRPRK